MREGRILLTDPKDIFINTIIQNSQSKFFDTALTEWRIIVQDNLGGKCICKQKLIYRNVLINRYTSKVIIVGNDCISRFRTKIVDMQVDIVEKAYNERIINDWEYDFYTSLFTQKKITIKQLNIKNKIDAKIKPFILKNMDNIDNLKLEKLDFRRVKDKDYGTYFSGLS